MRSPRGIYPDATESTARRSAETFSSTDRLRVVYGGAGDENGGSRRHDRRCGRLGDPPVHLQLDLAEAALVEHRAYPLDLAERPRR
jgi:hypothetical protein